MNRFKQIEQLGSGAYGVAVLVEEKSSHQKYVVKIMQLTKLPPEAQKSARGEISVLARLQHRNIVRYYDSFDENRCLHIVMEYCDGGDLERKMKQGRPLSEPQIWDYFVQICLALEYLHSKKVLHRDIKPANIFLTKKDEVKLGDFGVSKSLQNTLDMASTFAGTPVYLPPEMCNNQNYNDKCDMWSLGVILYEMVSGTLPFLAPNLLILAHVITRAQHKPLPPSCSKDLQIIVDLLLQKNPPSRPSAAFLLQRPLMKTICRRFLSEPELQEELERQVPHVPRHTVEAEEEPCNRNYSMSALARLDRNFGFKFNDKGKLVDHGSHPFEFNYFEDHQSNQKRYEAIGELITEIVYELLEKDVHLQKIHLVPGDEESTFIFLSENYYACEKLLVLIHCSGVVRAGQWSCRLIINDCLDSGTQLPYIRRAHAAGWGVLVMNTNDLHFGSHRSPSEHGKFVWRNFVLHQKLIKKIAIVAHGAGGGVTTDMLKEFEDDFKKRVVAIAFTDALGSPPFSSRNYFKQVCRNWVTSDKKLGAEVSKGRAMICLSAGTLKHEETSHKAIDEVFQFIKDQFGEPTQSGY